MTEDIARSRSTRSRSTRSRSTRKRRLRAADPFAESPAAQSEDSPDASPLSVRAADAALFGEIRTREGGRPTLRLLDIHDVQPDPQQPRRSLPRALRQQWDGRVATLPDLLIHWRETAAADFNMHALLALSDEERGEDIADPAFSELLALAASIRRDGLQHPITVARAAAPAQQSAREEARAFLLESGERRWLAFHFLALYDPSGERWTRIPANIQPERDVWRQASENSARDDLNAIARARQYALLLMDLWREREKGTTFQPIHTFSHEQDFYAQARDLRIPYGDGARLLNAMGRQHRNAFLRCRQLLTLPRALWERGDEENWREDQLLQAVKAAGITPEKAAGTPAAHTRWEKQFARWQRQLNPARLRRLPAYQRQQLRVWLRSLINAMGED